jgi:hypothetical protein
MDVECTPEEARKFFGLPDVQPLQAAMMAELEKRMRAEMERFSPEGLLNTWLSATPNVEWVQGHFKGMLDQAGRGKRSSE